MSISGELMRITQAKSDIITAIGAKGTPVPSGAKIDDLAALIQAIETGINTSDATATAADILAGKTAYARGEKLTGTAQGFTKYATGTGTITDGEVTINTGFFVHTFICMSSATGTVASSFSGFITGGIGTSYTYRRLQLGSYQFGGIRIDLYDTYPVIQSRDDSTFRVLVRSSGTYGIVWVALG